MLHLFILAVALSHASYDNDIFDQEMIKKYESDTDMITGNVTTSFNGLTVFKRHSKFELIDGSYATGERSLIGKNDRYCFRIAKRNPKSEWVLREVNPLPFSEAEQGFPASYKDVASNKLSKLILINVSNIRLDKLLTGCEKLEYKSLDTDTCVARFIKNTEGKKISGEVTIHKKYIVKQYKIVENYANGDVTNIDCVHLIRSDKSPVIPISTEQKSSLYRNNIKIDEESMSRKYWFGTEQEVDADQFYLDYYGIKYDAKSISLKGSIPPYVYFTIAGVAILVISILLSIRRKSVSA